MIKRTALAEMVKFLVVVYRTAFSCRLGEYISTLEGQKRSHDQDLGAGLLPSNPLGRSRSNCSPVIESHCGYVSLPSRLSAITEILSKICVKLKDAKDRCCRVVWTPSSCREQVPCLILMQGSIVWPSLKHTYQAT